jgi:CheY-like chemotaxis protein
MAQKISLAGPSAGWSDSNREPKAPKAPNILLIEDQMEDVIFIERAFRLVLPAAGLKVLHNGEEAIAYLLGEGRYADRQRYPMPDLILLDLQIPRKSGLEVLAWIWDQPQLKRIRVVVLTGSQNSSHIQRVHELDAYYQLKPSNFDELTAFIQTISNRWLTPESLNRRKMCSLDLARS